MSKIKVESLHVYPVKSCAGVELQAATIDSRGIRHDRYFMLIDEENNHVSQREKTELALVVPEMLGEQPDPDTICIELTAPEMGTRKLAHVPEEARPEDRITAFVHGKNVSSLLVNPRADGWFSEYLDMPVRLVAVDRDQPRLIDDRYRQPNSSNEVGFADGFSMLLASQSSLDDLNQTITTATGGDGVPMNRFRPNIVISGEALEPYAEDYWRRIKVGGMIATVVRPCARCEIPHIDQALGQLSRIKGLGKALQSRRGIDLTDPDRDKGAFFAQNLNHSYREGLRIHTGDEVEILDTSPESNVKLRS